MRVLIFGFRDVAGMSATRNKSHPVRDGGANFAQTAAGVTSRAPAGECTAYAADRRAHENNTRTSRPPPTPTPDPILSPSPCLVFPPQLFFSDPSGMFVRYKCKAIGSGSEGAQSTLQEGYSDSLTLAEAEALAVSTLKQVKQGLG